MAVVIRNISALKYTLINYIYWSNLEIIFFPGIDVQAEDPGEMLE